MLDQPLVDVSTGEIIAEAGTKIDLDVIDKIEESGIFAGPGLKEVSSA